MDNIEAYLKLQLPPAGQPDVCEELRSGIDAIQHTSQVMLVTNETNYQDAELSFSYPLDNPILDTILQLVLSKVEAVHHISVHLPSSLSGIRDAYDARDIARPLTEKLNGIEGVKDTTIGSNGVIRIEFSPGIASHDTVVGTVVDHLQTN